MQEAPNASKRPFSPPSFPARRKRRGRRRRVRNDHDRTNPCKQGFLSSVLVSSFPNRKLNLRFGFFYANLQQPLSLGCAEPAPLEGEPRNAHRRKYSKAGDDLSVSLRLPAPLGGEPCGEKSPPCGRAGASFYCFSLVLSAKYSFVSFATTPERAKRAMKFGMAMRPLKVSAMSHTTSSEATAPTTTMMMNRT